MHKNICYASQNVILHMIKENAQHKFKTIAPQKFREHFFKL